MLVYQRITQLSKRPSSLFLGMSLFQHFHSVYRFEALFANVASGWEKGSVENLVGYARRNYLVPLPEADDLETINADLRQNCLDDQQRIMARSTDPIASRLAFERKYLGPLPPHVPDLGPIAEVLVHSTGRVRFQTNDYSAPIEYAYQRLTLKADPFRVRLFAGEKQVADHPRCYEKRQVIEDWRHYLSLLLKKSFAVPWASALRHADLPPSFEAARLELVAHRSDGNREFVRLLELCVTHSVEAVEVALDQAHKQGGWSADTVRHAVMQVVVGVLPPRRKRGEDHEPDEHAQQSKTDVNRAMQWASSWATGDGNHLLVGGRRAATVAAGAGVDRTIVQPLING